MLEFIVLGRVPGTGWQLSFTTVLLLWALCMLTARFGWSYYGYYKFAARLQEKFLYLAIVNRRPVKGRKA